MRVIASLALAAWLASLAFCPAALAASADLEWARENMKAGRYADAVKRLETAREAAAEDEKPAVREFLAECYMVVGRYDDAARLFEKLEKPSVDELVLLGRAHMARGRLEEAEKALDRAFRDSNMASAPARADLIDLWELTNRRDEAELSRTWFFQHYQKISKIRYARRDPKTKKTEEVTDPRELVALARGIAKRDPQGAINAMTVAQQKRKDDVEPYVRSFFLFMERYAWSYAEKELAAAAQLNGKHPEVQLAVAYHRWIRQQNAEDAEKSVKAALETNPNLVPARVMMAQLHLFDDEYEEARRELDAALKVNPRDLEALATLAAYHYDLRDEKAFEEACARVLKLNPACAELYCTVAGACERKRQFPQAHKFYLKAIELDPESWRAYYGAGMALVRRGEDAEGKKLLEKAFSLNKYNLFCRNMLVVLDKLVPPEGYESQFESVKTEHFVIWAPKKDAPFLLPYYARCLEEAYARFHGKYSFAPENPTIVEVFSKHSQFSARTTGLPLIGADGACFGKLVTLDSPRVWQAGTVGQFNWATVAEHELMHVFSLQMTDYRIPRWLTEGLSVFEEQVPRIELDALFASAVRNGQLIKVKDLNRQMTRPTARANPLLAYYQARRIVEHVYARYGAEGMTKLLAACREGKKIEKAIPQALGCSLDEFEAQVLEHQKKFAAETVRYSGQPDQATMTRLQLEVKENPEDPEKLADLASAYLQGRRPNWDAARKYAEQAVAKDGTGAGVARGHAVLGLIAFRKDKKYRRACAHFEKAAAADPDSVAAHLYLGVCLGKEGRSEEALKHLTKAKELAPRHIGQTNAYEELYTVYRDLERDDDALAVLRERVAVDKKGLDVAVRLAKLALGRGKHELAAWAAYQAVKVDPFKPEPHLVWARVAEEAKDYPTAAREWELAAKTDPTSADARLGWARVLLAQDKKPEAKWAALEAKALEPDRPDIRKFLEGLGPDVRERMPGVPQPEDSKEYQRPLDDVLEEHARPGGVLDRPEEKKPAEPREEDDPPPVRELEKIDACVGTGRRVA